MADYGKKQSKCGRRQALKTSAIAIASLGSLPVVGSAVDKPPRGIYETSLKLRKKHNWDVHEWRAFLAKSNVDFNYYDRNIGGGPSTQSLKHGETNLHITYTKPYYSDDDMIDFEWEFVVDSWDDDGNYPLDNATIGYDDDHYTRTRGLYFDSYGSHITDEDSLGSTGSAIEWNDYNAYEDHKTDWPYRFSGYYGEYVHRNWEDYTAGERKVYVDLHHTWGTASLDSVSFGATGPTLTFSGSIDKWVREAEAFEYQMDDGDTYTDYGSECPC